MSIWYEEELAEHRQVVKVREAVMGYGRRVQLTTQCDPYHPDINARWLAVLGRGLLHEPIGTGPTEADAVYALMIEIETRELQEAEEAEEAEERARR